MHPCEEDEFQGLASFDLAVWFPVDLATACLLIMPRATLLAALASQALISRLLRFGPS